MRIGPFSQDNSNGKLDTINGIFFANVKFLSISIIAIILVLIISISWGIISLLKRNVGEYFIFI